MDVKICVYCLVQRSKNQFLKNRAKCNPCRSKESKAWQCNHKEHHSKYQTAYKKMRYAADLDFKLRTILRSRLRRALKNQWKFGSAVNLLGCSIDEFKVYIESKFQNDMNWSNWGRLGWHIDHIVPLDSFNLNDLEQLSKACHYTNMQPMWYQDNCAKSNKVI